MKVVFFEDVEGTAEIGDVKVVKNGFARNFLLPRDVAGAATKENLYRAQSLAEKESRRQAHLDEEWKPTADKLEGYTVSLEARVGETGRLFGSITNRDIAEAVSKHVDQDVDSRTVLLPEPIRELGSFPVNVKLTRNLTIPVTVEVVPDENSTEIVARLEAERAAQEEADRKEQEAIAYREAQEKAARGEELEVSAESDAEVESEGESTDAPDAEASEDDD